jgi:hypothetical protein
MKLDEDAIDTIPIIVGRNVYVEHETLELDVHESGELVFCPDKLMCRPILKVFCQGSEVRVEDIFSGDRALAKHGHWPVECFRDGQQLESSVSHESPLKIVVFNEGPEKTVVSASITACKEP